MTYETQPEVLQKQFLGFDLKAVEEKGIIRGHAAVFNNVDQGGDKIVPGAFDRTLKENGPVVPIFLNHDIRTHIGFGTQAAPGPKALEVEGTLTMDNPDAQKAYAMLRHAKDAGYRMGLSIGYRIYKDGWDMDGDVRLLKQVELLEWSVTPFPMNTRARITSVKSIGEVTERDFEAFLRDAGWSQKEAKTIISQGFRALKAQRDVVEPDVKTLLAEMQEGLVLQRWLAEQRNIITERV